MVSISFEKLTLPNGLEVIVHEDHSLPIAAVNVWYHVGSKDEESGRTGFAHLFEHVMFEGSKHHNRSYFDPLQKVGADLNGSTTPDRTNYWETVPSNYLELALWLESDRMGFLLEALDQKRFDVQRDVVKNERRQSYENRPYGMAHMLLQPAVFPAPHPYSWTTIGNPEDLNAANVDDVKDFFRRFYTPSNASIAIAGDVDTDEVRRLVERYFGDLPPGGPINRVGRMDSDLRGQVSLTTHDKVQLPRLYLVWPTGPLFDEDQAPLDVLSVVLGDGKSSRLYRSLVYEKRIARDIGIYHNAQAIAGELFIQATGSPGHELEELEEVILEELERIGREGLAEPELDRAKNRIEVHHTRQLERVGGFGGRADQLNYYNIFAGDPGGHQHGRRAVSRRYSRRGQARVSGRDGWEPRKAVSAPRGEARVHLQRHRPNEDSRGGPVAIVFTANTDEGTSRQRPRHRRRGKIGAADGVLWPAHRVRRRQRPAARARARSPHCRHAPGGNSDPDQPTARRRDGGPWHSPRNRR